MHYRVARGSAVNIVAIVEEEWHEEGWNVPGDGDWLLGRFASWCATARRLIATPTEWRKFGLASVDPEGPWVKGPVALLGDAAHAMMPFMAQGAAMAIEDAAVLAGTLASAGDDVQAGLRDYEAARRPRVTRVAEAARRTGAYFHWDPPLAAMRNATLRLIGPEPDPRPQRLDLRLEGGGDRPRRCRRHFGGRRNPVTSGPRAIWEIGLP